MVFLKRIVLHGFKSFADRTELDFGPGITAIVGPNGCGKSNVLDAVRWVLGTQSPRSLRGTKMSDVIFAGSRSRKPARCAEVQLTFDNRTGILRCDDEEVTVGRRLYASGESEYRLNGNVCRLKDIRDLLLDTGVGVDAYSAIEQGRVDVLLQASPAERREIFEEAAGISRYKVRRIEAQRKLERTQNNLLRLHDILEELERRLRSVRLAAGKARNFQQYDGRLRELRSSFCMAEYHELEQTRQRLRQEVQDLVDRLAAKRAELAERDADAAERSRALQTLDDRIQETEAAVLDMQTERSALEERTAQLERRLSELAVLRDRRRAQAGELDGRVADLERRLVDEEQAVTGLRAAEERSSGRIAEVQQERDQARAGAVAARKALEQARTSAFENARRSSLLDNELTNLGEQEQRLREQADGQQGRLAEIDGQRGAVQQRARDLHQRLSELDQKQDDARSTLRDEDTRLAHLYDLAEELDANLGRVKEQRSGIVSRLEILRDLEQRLAGVDRGTQAVLGWRDAEGGSENTVGLVADLLRIDDPRVALLQPVLATFENHVVVRRTDTFLEELQRRGALAGPVRVLSLEGLPQADGPVVDPSLSDIVARASDWVRCADEFRPLAEHLLGHVFVVATASRAAELARLARGACVFVTLDGYTVHTDGRLVYGTPGVQSGLISRKAEIRQLQRELDDAETRLEQYQRQRQAVASARADVELRKEALIQELASMQREQAELRSGARRLEEDEQRLEREQNLLRSELDATERARNEIGVRRVAVLQERSAAEAAQQAQEARIDALGGELSDLEAVLTRLSEEHTAALVERSRTTEKRAAVEEAVAELRARLETMGAEQDAARLEAEEAAGQIEVAERDLSESRARQTEIRQRCEVRQSEVLGLRSQRQTLRQQLEECGAIERRLQREAEELESERHEREIVLRETEVKRDALSDRVREELGLELAERYVDYEHCEQDWEQIRAEIEDLRGKIARLGNVNLDSISELEELAPRYERMVEQRDDLEDSVERLGALIEELDEESQTRFVAAFEQIRQNFQEMFRKLFGGGKADIILEMPENPLECGIEIIARPPGKEPRSISLLSGGERTMTAVALLMGVFKSRPSPFAILDEVDAALDESNVDRFNIVLTDFLSQSQFVVITHSKRTMARADVLYGITMEEPGVSKRVSVRFEDRVNTPSVA